MKGDEARDFLLINYLGEKMTYQNLIVRHQELEKIVDQAYKNYVSDDILKRFKKEKLKIKELLSRYKNP